MTTEVDLLNTIHEYADMAKGLNQVILSSDPSAPESSSIRKAITGGPPEKRSPSGERHIPGKRSDRTWAKMMSTVMTELKSGRSSTSQTGGDSLPGKQHGHHGADQRYQRLSRRRQSSLKLCRKTAETGRTPRRDHETVSLIPHPAGPAGIFFLEGKLSIMVYLHKIRNVCFIPPFRLETGGYCKFYIRSFTI